MLAVLVVLSMLMSVFSPYSALTAKAAPEDESGAQGTLLETEELDPSTLGVHKLGELEEEEGEADPSDLESDDSLTTLYRVSIFLEAPSAIDAGYSTENIGWNADAEAYRASLRQQQYALQAQIESAVGYELEVKWNLTLLTNAISTYVYGKDIPIIERMDGVRSVEKENLYAVEETISEPNTAQTSAYMVGAQTAWQSGYTGAGSRIAIIDTGIDTTHQSFAEDPFLYSIAQWEETFGETVSLMTASDIPASGLNGRGTYVSAKIPYAYNYIDENTTINHLSDTQGEHGSHVAGIAAANRYLKLDGEYADSADAVGAVGMAPDAQLLIMKVFGAGGGAYDSDYMAAIEDAIVLGADACNLSLGSSVQGYSYAGSYQDIMNKLSDPSQNEGLLVTISAGNNSSQASNLGTYLYLEDIYMHTGGSPGSFINSFTVASADNTSATGMPLVFNGSQKVFYNESTESDGVSFKNPPIYTVAGSYDFVYIDGVGYPEEYAAIDSVVSLSGKVVIVNRGSLSFYEKGDNAAPYNPVAVIVANNQAGTIRMDLADLQNAIPMVAISLADANNLKSGSTSAEAEGLTYYTGTVVITDVEETAVVTAREDAKVSDFSSWGIPGSLLLKPDITAPGGNIYSVFGTNRTTGGSTTGGSDQYEYMSGTSMAAPHMAGLTAIEAQYLKSFDYAAANPELAERYTRRAIMQSLLMSTADPMINDDAYVSLLQQGAGLADVSKAVTAYSVVMMENAFLTTYTGAAADGKVKAELGDDPDREGFYTYSFTIYNTADIDLSFELGTDIFVQGPIYDGEFFYMDMATMWVPAYEYYDYEVETANSHDVDKNGVTNDQDAQAILDYLSGANDGSELDLAAGDMDNNGELTSYDAYLLLQFEEEESDALVVEAGGSKTVTVYIQLAEDTIEFLEAYYTNGTYIQGFTYVECTTSTEEGVSYAHTHSIPMLAYYGSWTDASMFDNTSYTDVLYGTDKAPYTGNSITNYMTMLYSGVNTRFSGNPYMVEEEFPADKLAVNSTLTTFNTIYYNLIRSAGTTGFAVTEIDEIGGANTDIITSAVTGNEVDGIWYYYNQDQWNNLGTKFYSVNKTPASYGLEEGDIFRIGYYALPEYYGMLANGDMTDGYAGILSTSGFNAVILSGLLGSGAYVGYDFTIDNTEPEIGTCTLDGSTLTISATDNLNLAYVAVMSLDGSTIYAEVAPGAPTSELTLDATVAIENAHGYVAVFAADYAGNEVAVAVKVNDNTMEEKTVYVLTDTLTAGEDYLIVNTNALGTGYALGHTGTTVATNAVTVKAGIADTNGQPYIDSVDVASTSVWTVASGYTFKNEDYYLRYNRGLNISTTSGNWTWDETNHRLSITSNNNTYYLRYYNNTFSTNAAANSVYLYEKRTIITEVDPYNATSITLTPSSLDLYKGNEADLVAKVSPLTASDRTVIWSSSDTEVATVDENGHVVATGAGTATITAAANSNPAVYATCTVNVVSVNKDLNAIIWDEVGEVYFSSFNASSLPAWKALHEDDKALPLHSAMMADASSLYAGDLDTSTAETVLYSVDRGTYALKEYGLGYVGIFDMAPAPTSFAPTYFVYAYGPYLIFGNFEPEEDEELGTFSGFPYGLLDISTVAGDAWVAGVAARTVSSTSAYYYFLDETGTIWQTQLRYSGGRISFSTPTSIVSTGISTSFLYQSLYFDGTYLYWAHTDTSSGEATLYVINPTTRAVYNAGNFGDGVWPAAGLYVDGAVAPAAFDDEAETEEIPTTLERLDVSRDELMTEAMRSRIAQEAAKWISVTEAADEAAEEVLEEVTEETTEEMIEESSEVIEETEEVVEEPAEEPVEESSEAEEAVSEEAEGAEEAVSEEPVEESETESVPEEVVPEGTPNVTKGNFAAAQRFTIANPLTAAATVSDDGVTIEISEDEAVTNGLIKVTYDPEVLTFVGYESDLEFESTYNDVANGVGVVTIAYANKTEIAAETVLNTLEFEKVETAGYVTIDVLERGEEVAEAGANYLDEEIVTFGGPEFRTHALLLSEGKIGLNFYMYLPELPGADYTDSYMDFTVQDVTTSDPFDAEHMNRAGTYYGFTVFVNSIQMAETITAEFHYGEDQVISQTYSVEEYVKAVEAAADSFDAESLALVRATADYGYYAQLALAETRGWTIGEDYAAMETHFTDEYDYDAVLAAVADYAPIRQTGTSDVTKITYSLNFETSTDIFIYLKMPTGYNGSMSVTMDGQTYEAERQNDGRYKISIVGILAHELNHTYVIDFTTDSGSGHIEVSALSYVNSVLSSSATSVNTKNIVCALYNYYVATVNYRN